MGYSAYPKMKPDIKRLWVDALESGEYIQTRGSLGACKGNAEAFCCLGVLCELAAKHNAVSKEYRNGDIHYAGVSELLPWEVQEWAGIKFRDAVVTTNTGRESLSVLNDECYYTFAQIAKCIDESL
jgi:hypothetical protein